MNTIIKVLFALVLTIVAHAQPLQETYGGFYFPRTPAGVATLPSFATSNPLIDAADEAAGWVVQAPKTGNIRKVGWGTRTVTTGCTVDVRVETVTAGNPSGTLWGTNTNGAQVVADANDNVGFLTTLTADAAVTKGQPIGVEVKNPPSSFCNMLIASLGDDTDLFVPGSYVYTGSWTKLAAGAVIYFEYDDGTYAVIPGAMPIKDTITSTAMSTSTTPDNFGLRFKFPFPVRVVGYWLWADVDAAINVRLVTDAWHEANATGGLALDAVAGDREGATSQGLQLGIFDTSVDLAANTYYRLIVQQTTTTSSTFYDYNILSLAAMNAAPGGADFHLTLSKDPTADGSWTNYNSGTFRKPFMGLILSGFGVSSTVGTN